MKIILIKATRNSLAKLYLEIIYLFVLSVDDDGADGDACNCN